MESNTERTAKKRMLFLIFVSLVIVESGWWLAEEAFCEPKIVLNSKGEKKVSFNESLFCRIAQ